MPAPQAGAGTAYPRADATAAPAGRRRQPLHDSAEAADSDLDIDIPDADDAPDDVPDAGAHGATARALDKTWELVSQGMSAERIAAARGLSPAAVAEHIEKLILAGRRVNVGRYVAPAVLEQAERLFEELRTTNLSRIVAASGGAVTRADARIVRASLLRRLARG
jgi:hypothetical protein